MTFRPVSIKALKDLGKRIDAEFVAAKKLEGHNGLYHKLNKHYPTEDGWTLLCGPQWIGDYLVAFVCKPRKE